MVAGTAASAVKGLTVGRPHGINESGVSESTQLVVDRGQADLFAAPPQRLVQFLRTTELLRIVDVHGEGAFLPGRPAVARRHDDPKSSWRQRDLLPLLETATIPDSVPATVPDKPEPAGKASRCVPSQAAS